MGKQRIIFVVQDNESIGECLERMKKQGYMPTRRIEKPIFQEAIHEGQTTYEPIGRQITFEGKKID